METHNATNRTPNHLDRHRGADTVVVTRKQDNSFHGQRLRNCGRDFSTVGRPEFSGIAGSNTARYRVACSRICIEMVRILRKGESSFTGKKTVWVSGMVLRRIPSLQKYYRAKSLNVTLNVIN